MFAKRHHRAAALVAVLGSAAIAASVEAAPPNMYWNHLHTTTMSQAECVSKAEAILNNEKAGKIEKDVDSVRAFSDKSTAVVECLKFNGDVTIMILVGGEDAAAASKLKSNIEAALRQ